MTKRYLKISCSKCNSLLTMIAVNTKITKNGYKINVDAFSLLS